MNQFKALYSDIQVIRNYNAKLFKDLEPRFLNWTPFQLLGDIFLQVVSTSYLVTHSSNVLLANRRCF